MAENVRLRDVAEAAGVDTSTASIILGDKPKASRYAAATRERIFEAARRLNYQPNAAARALATRRTGSIGMTLSSQVPRGWANHYFAGQLVGVEEVCRTRGYALHINLYDMNDLESFVFPKHVQQRAVDGVILAGYVRSGIVKRFSDFGIPVVCIGENHEEREHVQMVRVDHVAKAMEAIRYGHSMGHRRIAYCAMPTTHKLEIARQLELAVKAEASLRGVEMTVIVVSSVDENASGRELMDKLASLDAADRPSLVIFTTLGLPVAVLKEMRRRGLRCPEDISLIADNDDEICEISDPPLTAMGQDLPELGRMAGNAVIDLLESPTLSPPVLPYLAARPLAIRGSVSRLG